MNPFVVLHHYLHQNRNLNVSIMLNSYFFTHPTGAGPMGLQAHTHVPLGLVQILWVCEISFCSTFCHNCCKAGNGKYYDYFIKMTHIHSKGNKLKLYT